MARVLVTGSTTGLGLAAATSLRNGGHDIILHARNRQRADDLGPLGDICHVVIGDLADLDQTRRLAADVNTLGPVDAVIHNAGVYTDPAPNRTVDGHPRVFAVNVLAPYLLTTLIDRPSRLIYLSSVMHTSGRTSLEDLDWKTRRCWNGTQAYCDSKLLVTTLAAACARHWPDVRRNAVDPGWVPTRMGGPHASDDLELGHDTQVWLATSDDPAANWTGRYWYHRRSTAPHDAVHDIEFQDQVLHTLCDITGQPLPVAA